jgi:uncharacterized surface protein with fasciclin (FAS1) repeats
MDPRYKNSFLSLLIIGFYLLVDIRTTNAQEIAAIQPERATIIQYIINDRPVMVGLLTTAGFIPVLSGDSPYTLLIPPEQDLLSLQNESPNKIREMLSDYILKGKYQETDFKDGATVTTISGNKLMICRKKGTLVNGVMLTDTNKQVRNGMVHHLQGLLK